MKYPRVGTIVAVIAVSAVIAILFWFFYPSLPTKKSIAPATQHTAQNKSGEILGVLFPHGDWADVEVLDRFDRSEVIRVISEARPKANKERATGMSFLLAALSHEYDSNRDVLFSAMSKCTDSNCRDIVAEYLMELGRRGDVSVLPALFDVADKADGHFAETLGGFYSDMLAEKPEDFLKALSPRPKKHQWDFCYAAGSEDGSGMDENRLGEARKVLKETVRTNTTLAPIARHCLLAVEAAHKAAEESFAEIHKSR